MLWLSVILLWSPPSTHTLAPQLNSGSDASHSFKSPKFSTRATNISAPTERDVILTCNVRNLGPFNVGWVKADSKAIQAVGDQVITHNPRVSVSGDMRSTFNLHISAVTEEDAGQYMCQVNTDPMMFQSTWLSVQVPPDIDMSMTSGDIVTREHEDTARFSCRAHGVPTPTIRWKREGGLKIRLRRGGKQRLVETAEGHTLEIHRVRREDMGAYLCIASNEVPPAVSKRIYLHVQFAPTILPGLSLLGSAAGREVTLECIVESYPAAFIVWSIEEKIVHGEEGEYTITERPLTMYRISSRLTIHRYHDGHAGTYRCQGTNSLGSMDSTIRVYTTERREPEYKILVTQEDNLVLKLNQTKSSQTTQRNKILDAHINTRNNLINQQVTPGRNPEVKSKPRMFSSLAVDLNQPPPYPLVFSLVLLFLGQ